MHERVERWIGCSGREGLISVISPYPARSTHLFDIRSMSSIPGVNLGRGNVMISYTSHKLMCLLRNSLHSPRSSVHTKP